MVATAINDLRSTWATARSSAIQAQRSKLDADATVMHGSKLHDQRSKLSAIMRMMLIVVAVVAVLLPTPSAAASSLGMIPESASYGPVAAQVETPTRTISRNEHTGEQGYKRVYQLNRGKAVQVCRVTVAPHRRGRTGRHRVGEATAGSEGSDEPPCASQEILSTRDHPYYSVSRKTWIDADALKPGELLRASDGSLLTVVKVEHWVEDAKTYNFEVEDWHSYFVSEAEGKPGIWVHNGPGEIGGHAVGPYKDVGSHHIIQNSAVEGVKGVTRSQGPAIDFGKSLRRGSQHHATRAAQRQAGGGTYGSERRIGYRALRDAGLSPKDARAAIEKVADPYFKSKGFTRDTKTNVPGDRPNARRCR